MYSCRLCEKQFEKRSSIGAHYKSAHYGGNKREKIVVEKVCPECKKVFPVERVVYKGTGIKKGAYQPKREKRFCSLSCANKRMLNEEVRKKIGEKVKAYQKIHGHKGRNKKPDVLCSNCGKKITKNKSGMCFDCCVKTGYLKKVAKNSNRVKYDRSKNEMLFCEMCEEYFDYVFHNVQLFNGWDADVILLNEKIAILWNGKWHYEKITEAVSLEQIQNRDRIKIQEIEKAKFTPYIIKDMGRHNPDFVRQEFNKFIDNFEKKC